MSGSRTPMFRRSAVVATLVAATIAVAPASWAAVPAISSFSPTSGPVGTSVTINGTGFSGATAVKFNGTTATFTVNSDMKITATVPPGATTGKISVTTPSGTDTSGTKFNVKCGAATTINSLHLRRHLRVRGMVTVDDGFSACAGNVPVQIQRRRFGGATWRTIVRLSTDDGGRYSAHVRNLPGRYRARAVRVTLATGDVCGRSASEVKRYRL